MKKFRRNYCNDSVSNYLKIWTLVDELTKDEDKSHTKEEMMVYIMRHTKGSMNPAIVSNQLDFLFRE